MNPAATKSRVPARRKVLTVHRWLSVGAAIFWLLQALTGIAIVFHWEITDALLPAPHRATDLPAIERRIDALLAESAGSRPASIWTTAGAADRYDVTVEDGDGNARSVRINGDGTIIRREADGETGVMDFLVGFHHDLLGSWGSWIVAISGLLLCSNIVLGIVTAWPRRGTWKRALTPAPMRSGPLTARLYGWHRAFGLWLAVPALVIAASGTMLKFEDGVGTIIGASDVSLPPVPPGPRAIGFAQAAGAALRAVPGSTLANVGWPAADDATFRVRVRAPGEIRRAYGGGIVLVNANDGSIRGVYPIARAELSRGFMSALFPIHTGEAIGLPGRLLSIVIGLWLVTMIVTGMLLWVRRRQPSSRSK